MGGILGTVEDVLGTRQQPVNIGSSYADHGIEGLSGASQQLADLAKQKWDLWLKSYGPDSTLGKQLMDEANLSPDRIETARGEATSDIERNYATMLRQREESNRVRGVDPNSGVAQSLGMNSDVAKSAARVGAGENAAIAEKKYRTGIGMNLASMGAKLGDWSNADSTAGVQAGAAGANAATNEMGANAAYQKALMDNSHFQFSTPFGGVGFAKGGPVDPNRYYAGEDTPTAAMPAPDGTTMLGDPNDPESHGHITGPGGPTDDAIDAKLSAGEYVDPAFSVDVFGVPFFDTVTEVARLTQQGDPEGKADAMKIIATVAKIGSKVRAPSRTAEMQGPGMMPPAAPEPMMDQQPQHLAGGGMPVENYSEVRQPDHLADVSQRFGVNLQNPGDAESGAYAPTTNAPRADPETSHLAPPPSIPAADKSMWQGILNDNSAPTIAGPPKAAGVTQTKEQAQNMMMALAAAAAKHGGSVGMRRPQMAA